MSGRVDGGFGGSLKCVHLSSFYWEVFYYGILVCMFNFFVMVLKSDRVSSGGKFFSGVAFFCVVIRISVNKDLACASG